MEYKIIIGAALALSGFSLLSIRLFMKRVDDGFNKLEKLITDSEIGKIRIENVEKDIHMIRKIIEQLESKLVSLELNCSKRHAGG